MSNFKMLKDRPWLVIVAILIVAYYYYRVVIYLYVEIVMEEVRIENVEGVSEYALELSGELYRVPYCYYDPLFDLYYFNVRFFNVNCSDEYTKFNGDAYRFNNFVCELVYLSDDPSIFDTFIEGLCDGVKGVVEDFIDMVSDPLSAIGDIFMGPIRAIEAISEFEYEKSLRDLASSYEIDLDIIVLDCTRDELCEELNTKLATGVVTSGARMMINHKIKIPKLPGGKKKKHKKKKSD